MSGCHMVRRKDAMFDYLRRVLEPFLESVLDIWIDSSVARNSRGSCQKSILDFRMLAPLEKRVNECRCRY